MIEELKEAANCLRNDYKDQKRSFEMSRLKQDLTLEIELRNNYRGREIYELLQNADDASSSDFSIQIDESSGNVIAINGGEGFRPFTAAGFMSLMMPHSSTKYGDGGKEMIGHKGLGFRSVLNWADDITICSNGVKVSFSKDVAGNEWNKIKDDLKEETASKLLDYARNSFKLECPVPVLSIPQIEKTGSDDDCTKIILKPKKEIESYIRAQIGSFDKHVLLFLRKIKTITISDSEFKVEREWLKKGEVEHVRINDETWVVHWDRGDRSFGSYELAVAYPEAGVDYKSGPVFSFFPTQVVLDLPCIVHGTFELDSSRNNITTPMPQNDFMMEQIAEKMGEVAEYVAGKNAGDRWMPYRILNLKTSFPALKKLESALSTQRSNRVVYPVVSGGYARQSEAKAYSNPLATFFGKLADKGEFGTHLIPDFGIQGIEREPFGENFCQQAETLAASMAQSNEMDELADFIRSIYESTDGKHPLPRPLRILYDDNRNQINEMADLNAGIRFTGLPDLVKTHYINERLRQGLMKYDDWPGGQKQRERNLREALSGIVEMTVVDLYEAKVRIARIRQMDSKQYFDLIVSLYQTLANKGEEEEQFSPMMHLHLLSADGSCKEASSLVLDASSQQAGWTVKWDQEWLKVLNASEPELKTFFHDVLGVSDYVPKEYVYFGDDESYLRPLEQRDRNLKGKFNYFSEEKAQNRDKNWGFRIPASFFDGKDLKEITGLIEKDEDCAHILTSPVSVWYFQSKARQIRKDESYMSFKAKESLKMHMGDMILSEMSDKDITSFGHTNDRRGMEAILHALGARYDYDEFSIGDLYGLLRAMSESKGDQPLQKMYQDIRRAIERKEKGSQLSDQEREAYLNGMMYRAKLGNELRFFPRNQVYYWDNDCLPTTILSQLPKLYIGNRVGVESVCRVFGVRNADGIQITLQDFDINDELSKEFISQFSERIPYLLAFRCRNSSKDEIDTYAERILKTRFKICRDGHYSWKYGQDDDLREDRLKGGDMIRIADGDGGNTFYVCANDISNGKDANQFRDNVAEAVCLVFKVRGDESMSLFRYILKSDNEDNEYLRKKEIPDVLWDKVISSIGLTDAEKSFWQKILDRDDVDFLASPFTRAQKLDEVLPGYNFCSTFPIPMPNVVDSIPNLSYGRFFFDLLKTRALDPKVLPGGMGLYGYYMEWLRVIRQESEEQYSNSLYTSLVKSPEKHREYLTLLERYRGSDDILVKIADDLKYSFADEKTLRERMFEKFDYSGKSDADNAPTEYRPCYKGLLGGIDLDSCPIEFRSMLLFDGHERDVESFLTSVQKQEEKEEGEVEKLVAVPIQYGIFKQDSSGSQSHKESGGGLGAFASDATKKRLGRRAEKLVKLSLESEPTRFCKVKPWSTNINVRGNNAKHYDFSYCKVGEEMTERFLEVKSKTGAGVLMSKSEYDFALAHSDRYDLAIVTGDDVTILESPFLEDARGFKLKGTPDVYRLDFNVIKKSS